VSEIKKKLGEDTLDDNGGSKQTLSKDSLREQARAKSLEADELYKSGRYKEADRIKTEARELYSKYGQMQ
jgi:hypothetical protein